MFDNRQYHGVIARAGRGRRGLLSRRVLEVNLLIIGALIFVGIGIASLRSDVSHNAKLESQDRTQPDPSGDSGGRLKTSADTPKVVVTTLLGGNGAMVRTAVLEVALPNYILTRATTLAAAQQALNAPAPFRLGVGAPVPDNGTRWIRSPHPLAIPVAFDREPMAPQITPAVFTLIPVAPGAEDRPAPLVRLDTRTGPSPFWYVMAGIMLVTFASGFRNSRKAHRTKSISTLSV